MDAWPAEMLELIRWFTAARGRLPTEPFALNAATWANDPARYYGDLAAELERGPVAGIIRPTLREVRLEVLRGDLKRLRELFG